MTDEKTQAKIDKAVAKGVKAALVEATARAVAELQAQEAQPRLIAAVKRAIKLPAPAAN